MILCNASWRLVILGGLATYKFSSKSDCSKNFRKRLAKSLINKLKNLRSSTAHSHPYLWLPSPDGTVAAEVQLSLNTAIKMQIDYQTLCDIYTLSFQCFTDFNARVCVISEQLRKLFDIDSKWDIYAYMLYLLGGSAGPSHSCLYPTPALPPLSSKTNP